MLFFFSCNSEDDAQDDQPSTATYDPSPYALNHFNLPAPNLPDDNPLTVQGVKLGRMLFYEPMLSKDGVMTCASCHKQSDAFTDTARFSIGVEGLPGGRQAMSVFNMAWHSNEFFWDGRSHLLRDQSLKPIEDPLEMNETLDNVVAKLSGSEMYKNQFIRAFDSDEITPEKMSLAMEQFMMTIVSGQSKYDKYLSGQAELSESELRGLALFEAEYNPGFPDVSGADCQHCHGGINFENDQYMNNGLDDEADITDNGREEATGLVSDRGKFKVPSLRNISLTPPYMHDGRFATLEEVVDHYNEDIHLSNSLDPALQGTMATGLMLTEQDKTDLVNFLKTLTDEEFINNPEFSNPF
jgi:cytochrome c peroxidase